MGGENLLPVVCPADHALVVRKIRVSNQGPISRAVFLGFLFLFLGYMGVPVAFALIASVLLVLWTGRKPTKRQWEALQLYWLGWVSLEELTAVLAPSKKSP